MVNLIVGKKKAYQVKNIPSNVSKPDILFAVRQNKITSNYIEHLKVMSGLTDELLSTSLNLNIKTFRSYKLKSAPIKPYLQEHVFTLLALFKHGIEFFGTSSKFAEWLQKENYFFDNDKPLHFLNTISGIRFTDERLTAMEFGDNV